MTYEKLVFPPVSYTGWGSIQKLPSILKQYEPKQILIVTDPILVEIGVANQITELMDQEGYDYLLYDKIEAEPRLELAEKLVTYTRNHSFDFVIGLGGGSALDLAKLAAVLSQNDGNVQDYLNIDGTRSIQQKGLPKILIPTTAGTGSEVTNISVLSLEHTKDVITDYYLLANFAICDPALTMTVPPKVTAATGIDALTHAIEAYVSILASPTTDALALHAIRLISRSLVEAYVDGENKQARIDMSYGSYLAGLAFFNAGAAGVHALAYPLGGQFHISHGESNAVMLPHVMDYIKESCKGRMADIVVALGGDCHGLSHDESAKKCIHLLEDFVEKVGIPRTLKSFNIQQSDLEKLAIAASEQKRLLARSPLPLELEDIRLIYERAYFN